MRRLERKAWSPTLVIPRAFCVFESVACKGLAWHERRAFAQMQAARLTPFKESAANAAVAGDQLMLWCWNMAEVREALTAAGLDATRMRFIAEPLLRKPGQKSGSLTQPCWGGIDQLELVNGGITRSVWAAGEAIPAGPLDQRTWASELLGRSSRKNQPVGPTPWFRRPEAIMPMTSATLALAAAGYLGYWGGTFLGTQQRLRSAEQQAELADQALGKLMQMKQTTAANERWVNDYSRMAAGVQFDRLLLALGLLLEQQGVVVREFELRQGEVRMTVRSAGGDLDLPMLLERLSNLPGIRDVQLQSNVELVQASFSFQVPGYQGLLAPSDAKH